METNLNKLIENISSKSTREILEDHVKSIELTDSKEIILIIDRKYAFNILRSHEHIWNIISWVKKSFWDNKETILKIKSHLMKWENIEHHDREMNIPYMIHYK